MATERIRPRDRRNDRAGRVRSSRAGRIGAMLKFLRASGLIEKRIFEAATGALNAARSNALCTAGLARSALLS